MNSKEEEQNYVYSVGQQIWISSIEQNTLWWVNECWKGRCPHLWHSHIGFHKKIWNNYKDQSNYDSVSLAKM